jgi:hypothetical protein
VDNVTVALLTEPDPAELVAVTLKVVVALTFTPVCVCDEAPVVVATRPVPDWFALHAQVVLASVFEVQAAVSVTLAAALIDEGFAVSEQPEGAPGVVDGGTQVNVGEVAVPPRVQLAQVPAGTETERPSAYAGAIGAAPPNSAATASATPATALGVSVTSRVVAVDCEANPTGRGRTQRMRLTNIRNLPERP